MQLFCMRKNSPKSPSVESEIARLEGKLKQLGAALGHNPNLPPEVHLAFLKRVYAFEVREHCRKN